MAVRVGGSVLLWRLHVNFAKRYGGTCEGGSELVEEGDKVWEEVFRVWILEVGEETGCLRGHGGDHLVPEDEAPADDAARSKT